jgi:hypothetical protein
MSDMPRTSLAGAALAALAFAIPAGPAAADGLPLPVEDSQSGVASTDGASRYLTVTLGGRTAVLAQRVATGAVTSRLELPGRFGVPLVAYDSTAGGLSADGRTLVLINPRSGFPRRVTTFAVLSATPRGSLRLRRILRLRGDFSYDALSRDGRSLFLINYLSANDPAKYRVRVYDLARDRLDPTPVVDPREAPGEMNGFPLARVMGRDGRWAYTLYQGTDGKPFIHALDTRDRKAVCIDLDDPVLARVNAFELRLLSAARGTRLDVRRNGALLATVDTRTFRVRSGPAAVEAARTAVASNDAPGPYLLWPALAAGLLGIVALLRLAWRRRGRPGVAPAAEAGAADPPEPASLGLVRR